MADGLDYLSSSPNRDANFFSGAQLQHGFSVGFLELLELPFVLLANIRLGEFEEKWDAEYLPIGQSWRRNWPRLIPFFDFPPEIRKVIYTTNAIESVNMSLRKLTKNRGSFPAMRR